MGLDYEKGEFTPEPHRMLSAQVFKIVSELEPGESGIVNDDVVWAIGPSKEGHGLMETQMS